MLTYGRLARSPIDMWCKSLESSLQNYHGEYLHTLKKKKAELHEIAKDNIQRELARARERVNRGKVTSKIQKGDQVMLRNETRQDSLDPRVL